MFWLSYKFNRFYDSSSLAIRLLIFGIPYFLCAFSLLVSSVKVFLMIMFCTAFIFNGIFSLLVRVYYYFINEKLILKYIDNRWYYSDNQFFYIIYNNSDIQNYTYVFNFDFIFYNSDKSIFKQKLILTEKQIYNFNLSPISKKFEEEKHLENILAEGLLSMEKI